MKFYSFSKGIHISDRQVNDAIRKGVDFCRSGGPHYDWASGDTQVVVIRYSDDDSMKVIVAQSSGYSSVHVYDGEEAPTYERGSVVSNA